MESKSFALHIVNLNMGSRREEEIKEGLMIIKQLYLALVIFRFRVASGLNSRQTVRGSLEILKVKLSAGN